MLTNSTAIYLLPDTFNGLSHDLFSNLIVNNVPIRHFKKSIQVWIAGLNLNQDTEHTLFYVNKVRSIFF